MSSVVLTVETGRSTGSAASRRLRAEGKVPAIVYGHGTESLAIAVDQRELELAFHTEAGRNVIFSLDLGGKPQTAIAAEIVRHPYKPLYRHIDFILVNLDEVISTEVPLHIVGQSLGSLAGAVMEVVRPQIEVRAVLSNLPSQIDLDVTAMNQGDTLRIGDLPVLEGVEYLEDAELTVVTITAASQIEAPEEEVEEGDEELLDEDGEPIEAESDEEPAE